MVNFTRKYLLKITLAAFFLCLGFTTLYSYTLVDLNFTLINNEAWESFRSAVIQIGYFRRDLSWIIYLTLILLLYVFHFIFSIKYKKINAVKLALVIGSILLFSYPALSHDFFNYMFDARIVTFYNQSPYLHRALDFEKFGDTWLRFMHWTHRTYPYGPAWLFLTLVPSFLSFGKLFINFFAFKLTFVIFYLFSVYYLNKMNKSAALFFATNPLVIIEGLVTPHNDLAGVAFAIIGIYYLFKKKNILPRLFLIFSAGIKYITVQTIFLTGEKNSRRNLLLFCVQIIILLALSYNIGIQPWYFLTIFVFLPFYEQFIYKLNIFFAGLLFSYYPYIRLGGWDKPEKVALKHNIIAVFFVLNLLYLLYVYKIKKTRADFKTRAVRG